MKYKLFFSGILFTTLLILFNGLIELEVATYDLMTYSVDYSRVKHVEEPVCLENDTVCWIESYTEEFGISSVLPMRISWCESGYHNIKNPISSAFGPFQFIDSTWANNCDGSKIIIKDNVRCGVRLISEGKIYHWGSADNPWGSFSCWKGYVK